MRARDVPGQLISAAPDAVLSYAPTIVQAGNTFSGTNSSIIAINGALMIFGSSVATNTINATLTIALPTGYSVRLPLIIGATDRAQVGMVNAIPLRVSNADTVLSSFGTVSLTAATVFTWSAVVPVAALA